MYLFKNNRTLSILLSSFLLLMVAACDTTSSEEGNGDPELYPLGEFIQDSYTVTAWSTRPLSVGFHEIYLEVMEKDRKSTRLNSSHVAISYAVFCLKKKNQRTRKHVRT